MISASCHCQAVQLTIDEAPAEVTDCNCSICRRYGVLWAYYSPSRVRIASGPEGTDTYLWDDRSIAFHRCAVCGCVTHWAAVDPGHDRMGVNARLIEPDLVADVRVRRLDGARTWAYFDEEPRPDGDP